MSQTVPLNESQSVTLNAFGDGTAKVGPNGHGVKWSPAAVSMRTNSGPNPTNNAFGEIFAGSTATQDNFVDSTYTASTGDSSGTIDGVVLELGQYVWGVWHNGDPGAQATITVTGTQEVG